jgi:hypothetical protein
MGVTAHHLSQSHSLSLSRPLALPRVVALAKTQYTILRLAALSPLRCCLALPLPNSKVVGR